MTDAHLFPAFKKLQDQYEYASDSFRDPPTPVQSNALSQINLVAETALGRWELGT